MIRFKKIVAFLLLFIHGNTSMFFPVVEERDIFVNGRQLDDVNSVAEFLLKKLVEKNDLSPTDEDDDQPDYFQLVKTGSYFPTVVEEHILTHFPTETNNYAGFVNARLVFVQQEVLTPPPDGSVQFFC